MHGLRNFIEKGCEMKAAIARIAGSLRAGSDTRALLRAAASHVPPGLRLTIWDVLATVPPFSEDLEAAPAPGALAELRQLIGAADTVLIVGPFPLPPMPHPPSPRR